MSAATTTKTPVVLIDDVVAGYLPGVNPALTESLLDHILDLKELGMTVLFVEHDMHMVRHIADWVVVMAEGRVVAEGPPDTVMHEKAVIDAYLGSHQDVDLGAVTGRIPVIESAEAAKLREEIEAAAEAELAAGSADTAEEGTA